MKIKFSGVKWPHTGFCAPLSLPPNRKRPVSGGRFTGVGFKVVVFQYEFVFLSSIVDDQGRTSKRWRHSRRKKKRGNAAFNAIPRKINWWYQAHLTLHLCFGLLIDFSIAAFDFMLWEVFQASHIWPLVVMSTAVSRPEENLCTYRIYLLRLKKNNFSPLILRRIVRDPNFRGEFLIESNIHDSTLRQSFIYHFICHYESGLKL